MGVLKDVILQHLTHAPHTWLRMRSRLHQKHHNINNVEHRVNAYAHVCIAVNLCNNRCGTIHNRTCGVDDARREQWLVRHAPSAAAVRACARHFSTWPSHRSFLSLSSSTFTSSSSSLSSSLSTSQSSMSHDSSKERKRMTRSTASEDKAETATSITLSSANILNPTRTRTMPVSDLATNTSTLFAATAALGNAQLGSSSCESVCPHDTQRAGQPLSASSLLADILHRRRGIAVPVWTAHMRARRWRTDEKRDMQQEHEQVTKEEDAEEYRAGSDVDEESDRMAPTLDATGGSCVQTEPADREDNDEPCAAHTRHRRSARGTNRTVTTSEMEKAGVTVAAVEHTYKARHTSHTHDTSTKNSITITNSSNHGNSCDNWLGHESSAEPYSVPLVEHTSFSARDHASPTSKASLSDSAQLSTTTALVCTSPLSSPSIPAETTHDAAATATMLVYNIFTRRVVRANAGSVHALALLGITVDRASRELRIGDDGAALARWSAALRAGRVAWPAAWSRGLLFGQIRHLLTHPPSSMRAAGVSGETGSGSGDEAVRVWLRHQVDALIRFYYARYRERQSTGCVLATTMRTNHSTHECDRLTQSHHEEEEEAAAAAAAAEAADRETRSRLLDWHDLIEEQQRVIAFVVQGGYHTYIGGGAGTGKSVMLRVLRQVLMSEGLAVAMTATTGIASCQIGGSTLHHTFGINVHGELTRRRECAAYDVIIIDEVSMLSRDVFETLERHLRRANGVDLPFGGVQMILCGDFLQLGAIGAPSLVTSPLFRRNFAMLRLTQAIRQSAHGPYAAQLAVLRRGIVPDGLSNSVAFLSSEEAWQQQQQKEKQKQKQQKEHTEQTERTGEIHAPSEEAHVNDQVSTKDEATLSSSSSSSSSSASSSSVPCAASTLSPPRYVAGAVNLLPTNAQVEEINQCELHRLPGEAITYPALLLGPSLLGDWTATYLLRRLTVCATHAQEDIDSPSSMQHRHTIAQADTVCTRCDMGVHETHKESKPMDKENNQTHTTRVEGKGTRRRVSARHMSRVHAAMVAFIRRYMNTRRATHAPPLDAHCIVLYPLFDDAYALRLRLPADLDDFSRRELLRHLHTLDRFLRAECAAVGVGVGEVLPRAEGLHTTHDEEWLSRMAERSPFARPVTLKLGCRVILRANVGPGLVNGSVGTVVGFEELKPGTWSAWSAAARRVDVRAGGAGAGGGGDAEESLTHRTRESTYYSSPSSSCSSAAALYGRRGMGYDGSFALSQEDCVSAYRTFLMCECGMPVAMVPVVQFDSGRRERITALMYHTGGSANTHYYTASIIALPLSLAYAFTVHKVQGLTLIGRVHLELSRMWPCEHLLYVAMSRVRNPEQLSISNFDRALVCAAADCLLFDDSLPNVYHVRVPASLVPATWRRDPQRRKRVLQKRRLLATSSVSTTSTSLTRRGSRVRKHPA